jgi:hypothetical protein
MGALIGFLGLAGLGVAVALLVARVVFKKGLTYRNIGVLAGVALTLFIVGLIITPSTKESFNAGREAGQQAVQQTQEPQKNEATAVDNEEKQSLQDSQVTPASKEEPDGLKESSSGAIQVDLEREPAKSAIELAEIIKTIIIETGNVKECYIVGAEEEVSTGGYWLSAEVKLNDAKNAWQVARNGVLGAYLNQGNVQLVKVSINIMTPPEDTIYALQVSAGKNHFDDKTIKHLKGGTWVDFQAWIEQNQIRGGYKQYADDLWAQGPLA